MAYDYITSGEELKRLCKEFQRAPALYLDTEFIRQTSYFPQLALVQISDGNKIALIDPLQVEDLHALFDLCFDNNIVKVLHSSHQDLEIFYLKCGKLPEPIFDTQNAAAALGLGLQKGYASLVYEFTGIEVDKSQTYTNWLQRPLTEKQCDYAANDVRYLPELYNHLRIKLERHGKLHWLKDDFKALSDVKTYEVNKMSVWKKVKGHQLLESNQLVILQFLAAFRETQSIIKNKIRKHILPDQLLINIARKRPFNIKELQRIDGMTQGMFQKWGDKLMSVIHMALEIAPKDYPILRKKMVFSQQQEAKMDCLMALCHLIAEKYQVNTQYLCQKKDIENIILGKPSNILKGWRNEIIGKPMIDFLAGTTAISISSENLQMS